MSIKIKESNKNIHLNRAVLQTAEQKNNKNLTQKKKKKRLPLY